jgi:hydroxyethylthiazole kinase-like uncharacterized protein yjeF
MNRIPSVTVAQMQRIEQQAITRLGMSVLMLMENAGRAVAETVRLVSAERRVEGSGKRFTPDRRTAHPPFRIIVLCGSGNNGGDGVVAARYLKGWGYPVRVWWVKNPKHWEGDVAWHYQLAKRVGVPFEPFAAKTARQHLFELGKSNLVIDALLGTGTRGEIRGLYREAIECINAVHRTVIAVDIPSGLDADSGKPSGVAVKATWTVTMALAKKGLLQRRAKPYVGRLIVADIGIPLSLNRR